MRRSLLLLLMVATGLTLTAVADAQPHKLDTPVESPLWWTLTDDLTPAELKRLYNDRSLSLERYDAAVEAGLAQPLPDQGPERRECLLFYFHPGLTPALEPMWLAFDTFYVLHTPGEHASEENVRAAPLDLQQKFGVSPSGVETILRAAATTATEFDDLMTDLGPKQKAMTLLLMDLDQDPLRAAAAPSEGQLHEAILQKDYTAVAAAVGRPESEIRELVDSQADWNVPYALVAEQLPGLKAELSESDWQGFRRYLLETVVARKGASMHFDHRCMGDGR